VLSVKRLLSLLTVVTALVVLPASLAAAHYNEGHEEACKKSGPQENNKHCDPCHDGGDDCVTSGPRSAAHNYREANDVEDTSPYTWPACARASNQVDQRAANAFDERAEKFHDENRRGNRRSDNVANTAGRAHGVCAEGLPEVDRQAEDGYDDGAEGRAWGEQEGARRWFEAQRRVAAARADAEARAASAPAEIERQRAIAAATADDQRAAAVTTAQRVVNAVGDRLPN
jgi:hypothetical protein